MTPFVNFASYKVGNSESETPDRLRQAAATGTAAFVSL